MSIRAVGWLGSKLGLDIGGRGADDDGSGRTDNYAKEELAGFGSTENRSSSADPIAAPGANDPNGTSEESTLANVASQWEAKLGRVWRQANEKATQFWNTNVRSGGGGGDRSDPFGFGSGVGSADGGNGGTGENPELDENGLPVTKNWYYYDAALGRWTVSADAPQNVQREYYEQLEEAERERLGQKTVVAPPPPPPRPTAGGPPPPPGAKAGPGGLFAGGNGGAGTGVGRVGHGPQYAMPDYFGSAAPPSQQPQPPYGGGADTAAQAPPSSHHLAAASFPPPPSGSTGMGSPSSTGYTANSPYSNTLGSAPVHSSPYPPMGLTPPHDARQAVQTQSPPVQASPFGASPYGTVPYPPSTASPSQPAPPPVRAPTSRSSPSPSGSSLQASYVGASQQPPSRPSSGMPDPYGAALSQVNALASPTSANSGLLPRSTSANQPHALPPPQQQQHPYPPQPHPQPYTAYLAPQNGSVNTYSSGAPYATNNVPSLAPATPPMPRSNGHSASATGHFSDSTSLHTQGSPLGSPYASAPPLPPPSAAPAPTGNLYTATATTQLHTATNAGMARGASTASGAGPAAPSLPSSTWQSPPPPSQLQQPAAPSSPPPPPPAPTPASNNPFAPQQTVSASAAAAPPSTAVAAPPMATPVQPPMPPPPPPLQQPQPALLSNGNGLPPGGVASPTGAPSAARLPPPPSFRPFSPS